MRELNKYSIIISVADSGLEGSQAKQYEDRVEACILQCTSTVVGRAVIAKIRAHGRVVVIPYTNRFADKFKTGNLNAMSLSTDSSIEFNPLVRKYFDPVFARSTNIVCFSPMRYDFMPASNARFGAAGFSAPDILLHELVHAGRELGGDGRKDEKLRGSLARYDDEGEYFAVLVTNIHMSEIGRQSPLGLNHANWGYPNTPRTNIRADHRVGELPPELTISENYLKVPENFSLVNKYWNQHPTIAPMIARSPARFNPIRCYSEWLNSGLPWWIPPEFNMKLFQRC